jgi:hypothetical protein
LPSTPFALDSDDDAHNFSSDTAATGIVDGDGFLQQTNLRHEEENVVIETEFNTLQTPFNPNFTASALQDSASVYLRVGSSTENLDQQNISDYSTDDLAWLIGTSVPWQPDA